MIYQFHQDQHGEVVAETVKAGIESFNGLHYPASDIPAPARSLFLETRIRMIPDVGYTPQGFESLSIDVLDLGKVLLRAVSPIHIKYLTNMRVGASLTISILVAGKLWGLIACHHQTAKYITPMLRNQCGVMGRMISSLIEVMNLKEKRDYLEKIKSNNEILLKRLSDTENISQELTQNSPGLLELIYASGASAALYENSSWFHSGRTLPEKDLNNLVEWISNEHVGKAIFYTNHLSQHFPPALNYPHIASGLLAISVPKNKSNYIFWFRPEVVKTVNWAGDPQKSVSTENNQLSPRSSFNQWKQEIHETSLPWQEWEIEAALALRNTILAIDLKKQFEKEQQARREAELAVNAREELMGIVSHDLKNPLSSILLQLQLIKKHLSTDEIKIKAITDKSIRTVKIMTNLIEDILSITKLESGGIVLEKKSNSLNQLINETVAMLEPLALKKEIEIKVSPTALDQVNFDYDRIFQVISNLLGNALKFTGPGGRIDISAYQSESGFINIKISDNGPGIPQENISNVFDRFWQAKQTNRLGTGLGLSIAKGIVTAHGGEIWVNSQLGEGAHFEFSLPLSIN